MSVNVHRNTAAPAAAPGLAEPESKAPQTRGPRHPSIFSKPLFSRAPKSHSTSMAPRASTPLLSPEQRATPSDSPSWSMKSATSALGHAASRTQEALTSGAKVMSGGMLQAGKAMASAYQTLNQPSPASTHPSTPAHPQVSGQGGRPQGAAPAHTPPSVPAKTAGRTPAPLGAHAGHVQRPAARPRAAAGGAENADPNVGRLSPHAAVKKNTPPLVASFSTDRPLAPAQLVEAMVNLAKGTRFEAAVSQEIARNPAWGQQMQQRWNVLRLSIADAREGGDPQVPALEHMLARRPASFIKFMGGGNESSFARLMRPMPQSAPAQPSAVPEAQAHTPSARPSTRPQARVDTRQEGQGPQAPRTGHAAGGPGRNERKPMDERTRLTAALRDLDQRIAASEQKGHQIRHRMFNAPTGAERTAATRESYAHRDQHNGLIAGRNQVQARLQHIDTHAAAGQRAGRLKDGGVAPAQAQAPAKASPAAARARQAELDQARAIVAKGQPDLGKMYSEAIERVERNNRITQSSTLLEPEDRHIESVDFAAIDKKFDQKMARYEKAKAIVDAADNPEQTQARAAAFQAEVRAEARRMAEQAYHADVREAEGIVKQGPVSYDMVMSWAQDAARQNYRMVGGHRLDHDAIVSGYDRAKERYEEARQLISRPLTGEETAARIDAQMAAAERLVRQRQEGAAPGR